LDSRIPPPHAGPISRWRRTFASLVFGCLLALPLSADHDPLIPESAFEVHTHGRVFYDLDDLSVMLEYVGRFEDEEKEFRYQSATLGSYYQVAPKPKDRRLLSASAKREAR